MDKHHVVITIARQYGSGGRTLGVMLSEKYGIPFYDKDIIKLASEESGIKEEIFGRVDEYVSNAKPSLFKKNNVYTGEVLSPDSKDFTSEENLFNIQAKVMRDLAAKGSCVIIGRCSNFVLKDDPHTLSLFVHASEEFRREKASEKLSMTGKELEKFLVKDDKRKMDYYRRFTGGEWFDARNYDLCLNSSKLGYDKCIEEIDHRIKIMFE